MKRSHVRPGLIPLDAASSARQATREASGASPTNKREADWFRIVEDKKASEADVYVYDEIGFWGTTASDFAATLRDLDVKHINMHLNSPGGEVFDGVAIYNTIVNHKATVTVFVDGLAASAASFIAQAGDEIIMGKGSTMMIHDASGLAWGNASEMRDTADILDGLSQTIATLYTARAGGTDDEWRALMKAETWYNAAEAVEAGLADKVGGDLVEEPAEDRWNLSVFNYAGRGEAPSPQMQRQSIMNRINKEVPVGTKDDKKNEAPVEDAPVELTEDDEDEDEDEGQDPATDKAPVVPTAKAVEGFVINGVRVTDPKAIQTHIASLEGFVTENKKAGRKAFVDKLAHDGKIVAPQAEGIQTLVDTLNDEQYATWCATWDAAQPLPLFARHGSQDSPESAVKTAAADRIEVLEGIVAHHKSSGLSQGEIESKDSWIELQALKAASNS